MRWNPPSNRTKMIIMNPLLFFAEPIIFAALSPLILKRLWEKCVARKTGWCSWYAWWPVRCDGLFYNQQSKWVWLERVERFGSSYRLPEWGKDQ